jgi:hypothetical protein
LPSGQRSGKCPVRQSRTGLYKTFRMAMFEQDTWDWG